MASPKLQLIDSRGEFRDAELQEFVSAARVDSSSDYLVVAIMGPQSSGKSTLVNHVFGTDFVMLSGDVGRRQTTKGVWLSKAPNIAEPLTLVMDLEGSDGKERGPDDINFERQSALFALAVADVLIVNMWANEIGREHGSGTPLLRTIFQVNLKLFKPEANRKRTVLLFVIRDHTKKQPRLAEDIKGLEASLDQLWVSIAKPPQYENSSMKDFFDVQFAAMSHFEFLANDFKVDAANLRLRFRSNEDGTFVRQSDHMPGTAFALSTKEIWEAIRTSRDLNLPAIKDMVANTLCAQIATQQLSTFKNDQAWNILKTEACSGSGVVVRSFNTKLLDLMNSCIQGYDADALYYDVQLRGKWRAELSTQLWREVEPVMNSQVTALHNEQLSAGKRVLQQATGSNSSGNPFPFATAARTMLADATASFKRVFEEDLQMNGTPWDAHAAEALLQKLQEGLEAEVKALREKQINDAVQAVQRLLPSKLTRPVMALLKSCPSGLWRKLHAAVDKEIDGVHEVLMRNLNGFEVTQEEQKDLKKRLVSTAQVMVENLVRLAASDCLSRMNERFSEVLNLDEHIKQGKWRSSDSVSTRAHNARIAAAEVLSQLAVIHPLQSSDGSNSGSDGSPDTVGSAALKVESDVMEMARADMGGNTSSAPALDALHSWPGVPEEDVLLQPHEIHEVWLKFRSFSKKPVLQARKAELREEALKRLEELKNSHGIDLSTRVLIFNETGGPLHLVSQHHWAGRAWSNPPDVIPNGEWGVFLHVQAPLTFTGSEGAVIYAPKQDGDGSWVLSWSHPWADWAYVNRVKGFVQDRERNFTGDWSNVYKTYFSKSGDAGQQDSIQGHRSLDAIIDARGRKPVLEATFGRSV